MFNINARIKNYVLNIVKQYAENRYVTEKEAAVLIADLVEPMKIGMRMVKLEGMMICLDSRVKWCYRK